MLGHVGDLHHVQLGQTVYGRVSLANKYMEPEIECVNPTTGKSAGFGLLKDGYVLKTSLNLCRRYIRVIQFG